MAKKLKTSTHALLVRFQPRQGKKFHRRSGIRFTANRTHPIMVSAVGAGRCTAILNDPFLSVVEMTERQFESSGVSPRLEDMKYDDLLIAAEDMAKRLLLLTDSFTKAQQELTNFRDKFESARTKLSSMERRAEAAEDNLTDARKIIEALQTGEEFPDVRGDEGHDED